MVVIVGAVVLISLRPRHQVLADPALSAQAAPDRFAVARASIQAAIPSGVAFDVESVNGRGMGNSIAGDASMRSSIGASTFMQIQGSSAIMVGGASGMCHQQKDLSNFCGQFP